jgi:hypothetical protein
VVARGSFRPFLFWGTGGGYVQRLTLILLQIAVFVGATGCVRVGYIPTNASAPARPENCPIQIFTSRAPDRPYVELGIVEARGSAHRASLEDMLPEMRQEACLAGGDGIIMGGAQRSTTASGSFSLTGGSFSTIEHLNTTATVIRFQDSASQSPETNHQPAANPKSAILGGSAP